MRKKISNYFNNERKIAFVTFQANMQNIVYGSLTIIEISLNYLLG